MEWIIDILEFLTVYYLKIVPSSDVYYYYRCILRRHRIDSLYFIYLLECLNLKLADMNKRMCSDRGIRVKVP